MAGITKVNGINVVEGNGLGPRARILSLSKTNITAGAIADLNSVVTNITAGGAKGVDDAVSVVAVDHTSANVAHIAVQGSGVLTPGANYLGVTGVTSALVTDFDQNPA